MMILFNSYYGNILNDDNSNVDSNSDVNSNDNVDPHDNSNVDLNDHSDVNSDVNSNDQTIFDQIINRIIRNDSGKLKYNDMIIHESTSDYSIIRNNTTSFHVKESLYGFNFIIVDCNVDCIISNDHINDLSIRYAIFDSYQETNINISTLLIPNYITVDNFKYLIHYPSNSCINNKKRIDRLIISTDQRINHLTINNIRFNQKYNIKYDSNKHEIIHDNDNILIESI
jgi:hypothetical protein